MGKNEPNSEMLIPDWYKKNIYLCLMKMTLILWQLIGIVNCIKHKALLDTDRNLERLRKSGGMKEKVLTQSIQRKNFIKIGC
jgi:hypothetical protein